MALSTPKLQNELMAHQTTNGGFGQAHPVSFALPTESHHNKPEEHEETKEKFDEDISIEEALSTL